MNRKHTREHPVDGDAAPTRTRPYRGKGAKNTKIAKAGKTADRVGAEPVDKTGEQTAPTSIIHTVARDVLLPYQVRWIADDAAVKVAEKSRRVGITWAEAADAALSAAATAGMDTWYLGYNRDMAREFVETAAAWARQFNKAAQAIEEIAIEDERRD